MWDRAGKPNEAADCIRGWHDGDDRRLLPRR